MEGAGEMAGEAKRDSVIRLVGLDKVYQSGEDVAVHAVRAVSLEIERGDFVAIMGPSGSGKSTLMNMLGCLDRPSGGEYWLEGEQVGAFDRDRLARVRNQRLGFVFQGFNLLSRTSALENVELPMLYSPQCPPRKELRRRALAALERVGLGKRAGHHPSQLSGGQQQRVAIARALVNEPSFLLADEPTGNLDTRTSLEIMEIFQDLNDKGMTILMVTHEPDIAQYCRRQIVLRDGVIVRDERVEKPLRAGEELKRLPATDELLMGGARDTPNGGGEGGAEGGK